MLIAAIYEQGPYKRDLKNKPKQPRNLLTYEIERDKLHDKIIKEQQALFNKLQWADKKRKRNTK